MNVAKLIEKERETIKSHENVIRELEKISLIECKPENLELVSKNSTVKYYSLFPDFFGECYPQLTRIAKYTFLYNKNIYINLDSGNYISISLPYLTYRTKYSDLQTERLEIIKESYNKKNIIEFAKYRNIKKNKSNIYYLFWGYYIKLKDIKRGYSLKNIEYELEQDNIKNKKLLEQDNQRVEQNKEKVKEFFQNILPELEKGCNIVYKVDSNVTNKDNILNML